MIVSELWNQKINIVPSLQRNTIYLWAENIFILSKKSPYKNELAYNKWWNLIHSQKRNYLYFENMLKTVGRQASVKNERNFFGSMPSPNRITVQQQIHAQVNDLSRKTGKAHLVFYVLKYFSFVLFWLRVYGITILLLQAKGSQKQSIDCYISSEFRYIQK